MLVLQRKIGESFLIGGTIRVTFVALRGNQARIGIDAPQGLEIVREELLGEWQGRGNGPRRPSGPGEGR